MALSRVPSELGKRAGRRRCADAVSRSLECCNPASLSGGTTSKSIRFDDNIHHQRCDDDEHNDKVRLRPRRSLNQHSSVGRVDERRQKVPAEDERVQAEKDHVAADRRQTTD